MNNTEKESLVKDKKCFSGSFHQAPYIVLWELTRACALNCVHCRASAIRKRDDRELTFEECCSVMDRFSEFGKPLIVLTGGDPVWRPDLFQIVKAASERGFTTAITPSATPRTTENTIRALKDSGIARIAVSLDGPDRESHDAFRRVPGSFDWTLNIINWANKHGLPIQINSTIWKGNFQKFEKLIKNVEDFNAVLWSAFFLVPTGRAGKEMQISSTEAEEILLKMAALAKHGKFDVKATAAPHFRRVLLEYLERNSSDSHDPLAAITPSFKLGALRSYQSVNDGKGIMFISHVGDIYPSGFLPLSCGNIRETSLVDVYRQHPLFNSLRDAQQLGGKCGTCRYKELCGGSRARAFAESGSHLAEDTLCSFVDTQR
ncbi:MAG TPA: TIGR04053 family radical SAM/SPASM domain-containing protein [Candidatus Melainabacteria bacterium]|nr:TIGR04053 family radical SAM/SPASM domain-containing protein [Candidatus Melainabacteria bacterium]